MAKPNKSEKDKRANEAAQRRAQAAREKVAAAARKTNDDLRDDAKKFREKKAKGQRIAA
jgi:hypothetical protein